ncbi:MAG TPA: PQQ-binding-like beta-propeller repeat protein, partial [Opitutaceae bacterium]
TLLDLGAIPPNDNFAAARLIAGRSAVIQAANAQATLEAGEPRIRSTLGGKSLWYRWTAPSSDRFQFSLASEGFDPLLAVYTGSSLASLALVASSDNGDLETGGSAGYAPTAAIVTVEATAGVTYYIQADGRGSAFAPPPNAPLTLILNDSLWQSRAKASFTTAPVVGPDGAAYLGSTDGYFHAFNADGKRRWPALDLNEAQQDTSAAALSPDGILYVGLGPTLNGTTVVPGKVRAIDSATGATRWEINAGTLSTTNANNAIALAEDGTIYVHTSQGRLLAYTDRGASAQLKWSAAVPGLSYASPTIAPDGTVYLGSDEGATSTSAAAHRLYAFNPADGSMKWSFPSDNAIYTAAAIDASGNLYFGTLVSGRLYSLTSQGTQRWLYAGARLGTSSSPSLSPDGGTVYFAGYDGVLHAVNTSTGTARWTYKLGAEVRASSPAVDANGVIYIGSYDGLLYAINADGALNRTWATGTIIRSSPAIAGNTLYVGSNDGGLYAFDIGASAAGPWPQYRHNARRTGRAVVEPPVIALSPSPYSAVVGDSIELAPLVTGTGPFAYQWFKDGVPIAGATSATLALPAVTLDSTGNYSVAVSSEWGSALSSPGAVVVRAAGSAAVESRLVNLSVRAVAGAGERTLIVGFFVAGSPDKSLLVRAVGPTLSGFGVAGVLDDPRLQLISGSTVVAENDNWGSELTTLLASVGAFPLPAGSRDSALSRTLQPGSYTAQITGPSGSGIALAEVYDAAPGSGARLANLSARSQIGAGNEVLIAGFAISGNTPRTVLIRAVGPGLAPLGVAATLTDPRLALYRGPAKLGENDQWRSGVVGSVFSRVGAFALPTGSRDAALLVSLTPGAYTAQVSGDEGASGVVLIEVYEAP